jgi:hypothetical protein
MGGQVRRIEGWAIGGKGGRAWRYRAEVELVGGRHLL